MLLIQDPILTQWKTLGKTCWYVHNYFYVLLVFAKSLCAMKDIKNESQTGNCAANYEWHAKQEEIEIDLAFVSDFHQFFFDSHMEFNHSIDPNIGASEGLLVPHHLVWYYLKVTELKLFENKLENGSVTAHLVNSLLNFFWKKWLAWLWLSLQNIMSWEGSKFYFCLYQINP